MPLTLKHKTKKSDKDKIVGQKCVSRRESMEDQCQREHCLKHFRLWIKKNSDVREMRMDDLFLLRFLRAKKYHLSSAQQMMLKYLNVRRVFPHMSTKLDYLEPKLNDILRNGYIFVAPQRDKYGRRVVIINAKGFNAKLYNSADQARAHFLTYECLMEEPETQLAGVLHVGDFSGVTTAHVTNWSPTEFARVFKWSEQSLPMRHKEIHLVNVPTTLKWLIEFVKKSVSSKIKDRLTVYSSERELLKVVDVNCLPLELGGKMPMKEMVKLWLKQVATQRQVLLDLDNIQLMSDRGIQRRSRHSSDKQNINGTSFVSQIQSLEGCFRKLDLD